MAYTPYYSSWVDSPSTSTPIIAAALNNIETGIGAAVLRSGDTMTGPLAMGSHKVTGLSNGTASSDAAAFGQTPAGGSNVTIAQGGTGQTTQQAALDALAGAVTTGLVLAGNGSHVTLRALVAADLPTGTTSAKGALQLDGTSGDIAALGAQAAGSSGLAADAEHVHPTTGLLLLTGGTMSGAIAMGSHKITGLTNGSSAQDAAAFGQIPTSAGSIGGLLAANNLSDVSTASTARTNLGLGTAATQASSAFDAAGAAAAVEGLPLSLTGATAATRYVGATTSGAPVSGTFLKGDFAIDQTAAMWICTTAGSPGTWTALSGGSGMSNPMTTLGDLIYENGTPAAARLAGNTSATKKFLTQTGTGSVSASPGWNTISSGDIPDLSATYLPLAGGSLTGLLAVTTADDLQVKVVSSGGAATIDLTGPGNGAYYSGIQLGDDVFPFDGAGHYWGVLHNSSHDFQIFNYNGTTYQNVLELTEAGVVFTANNTLDDGSGDVTLTGVLLLQRPGSSSQFTLTGQDDGTEYSNFNLADDVYPLDASGHYWSFSHRSSDHHVEIYNYDGSAYTSVLQLYEGGYVGTLNNQLDDGFGNVNLFGTLVAQADAYTAHNTLDDGSGNASFLGAITNSSDGTHTSNKATWIDTNELGGGLLMYSSGDGQVYQIAADIYSVASNTSFIAGLLGGWVVTSNQSHTGTAILGVGNSTTGGPGLGNAMLTVYDDNFVSTYNNILDDGTGSAQFEGYVGKHGTATTDHAFVSWINTDGQNRYQVTADGTTSWGVGGSTPPDTTLARDGGGGAIVVQGLHTTSTFGILVDAGGIGVTAGGIGVTAGGIGITAGGLTVSAGLSSFAGGTDTSGTASASSQSFVSGTAKQLNTSQDVMLYIYCKTSGSQTSMALLIGPTSTPATSIISSATATPALGSMWCIRVPKSWWVKFTASTMADFTITQVTC